MHSALYAIARLTLSVYLSVLCPSHEWISQKRLKLESCNFHYRVAQSLQYSKILTGSPERGRQKGGVRACGKHTIF